MNTIGKSGCEEGNAVSRDQRSGPFLRNFIAQLSVAPETHFYLFPFSPSRFSAQDCASSRPCSWSRSTASWSSTLSIITTTRRRSSRTGPSVLKFSSSSWRSGAEKSAAFYVHSPILFFSPTGALRLSTLDWLLQMYTTKPGIRRAERWRGLAPTWCAGTLRRPPRRSAKPTPRKEAESNTSPLRPAAAPPTCP